MNKLLLFALFISFTLAKQDTEAKSTYGEPADPEPQPEPQPEPDNDPKYYDYDELVIKLNEYREKYANMYKDIEIDQESKDSSKAELKRLINDIDSFAEHEDFEDTYKKTYNSPSQFCEFICKLHQQYTSNAQRCIDLWDKKEQLRNHMRLEYATGGSTCTQYGNGVLCVMHVREYSENLQITPTEV